MSSGTALFKNLLKKNGFSITAPRVQLFQVLNNHNACTMTELSTLLTDYDRATVYRTVKLFEKLGIVNRLQLGWKYKLELSDVFHHHHHHLSCVNCGKVTVLPEDFRVEIGIKELSRQHGFKPLDHQLEIRGLCIDCQ